MRWPGRYLWRAGQRQPTSRPDRGIRSTSEIWWWALRVSNPRPSPCKGEPNVQVRGLSSWNGVPVGAAPYLAVEPARDADVMHEVRELGAAVDQQRRHLQDVSGGCEPPLRTPPESAPSPSCPQPPDSSTRNNESDGPPPDPQPRWWGVLLQVIGAFVAYKGLELGYETGSYHLPAPLWAMKVAIMALGVVVFIRGRRSFRRGAG